MKREELLDRLTGDILAYVMHGTFPERRLARELKPAGLDERFDDYETLVRLHYILREDVVDFVEALPERLRSIKTQTETVSRVTRGTAEGRINWSDTYRERYATNPRDGSLFVCENRSEHYDIDENIVLKRLLSIIYRTLDECETYLRREYEWVTERWRNSLELVDVMRDIFERNVHVRRIREPATYEPTDRMLDRAANSRSEIYRATARLLREYRSALAGEEAAIRDLLNRTAITPDDDETLFELFVLFEYISTIDDIHDGELQLRTIESGSQEIARMAGDDTEFVLYHDSSARDRDLSFTPDPIEKSDDELSRPEMVRRRAGEVVSRYFREGEASTRSTLRPDVIVLELRRGEACEYLITEVKNSARRETVRRGIEETLEYLAFLRRDDEFVFDSDTNYLGSGWNGLLVVQDIHAGTLGIDSQADEPIGILQASEVHDKLETVIENILGE